MKKLNTLSIHSMLLVMFSTSALAVDIKNGKSLHDSNCISCHTSIVGGDGTGIYTREDRKIESLAGLQKQVRRCKDSMGMSWPEAQIQDVIGYLNQNFYHFKKENE